MKFTLLFSILFFASQTFSQAPNQPFSTEDILLITNQYAIQQLHNADRSLVQKLDSSHVRIFSGWSQSWVEGPKTRYEYYGDGTLKSQISETYQSFIEIMEFNPNGKIAYHKYQNWNGTFFADSYNTVYLYDNNEVLQSDTSYDWIGSNWVASNYSEYQMDSQGYIQQKINYHLQGVTPTPTQKFSFVNDGSGNTLNLTTFQYMNLQWVNHYNYFYSYNSAQRIEVFYYQNWFAGNWMNRYNTEYTYASNNEILSESYDWDNGAWILDTKQESQYDNNVSSNTVWLPASLRQNNNMVIGNQSYFNDTGIWGWGWSDLDSTKYFYSEVTPNSVPVVNKVSNYKLQTNPVVSEISIVNKSGLVSQIKVYSSTGKLVISQTSSQSLIQLDANKLSKGMYLVHLTNATERIVLKVLVSK